MPLPLPPWQQSRNNRPIFDWCPRRLSPARKLQKAPASVGYFILHGLHYCTQMTRTTGIPAWIAGRIIYNGHLASHIFILHCSRPPPFTAVLLTVVWLTSAVRDASLSDCCGSETALAVPSAHNARSLSEASPWLPADGIRVCSSWRRFRKMTMKIGFPGLG